LRSVAASTRVNIAEHVHAVAAGASHTLALTTAGEVRAWGSNNHGQLGCEQPKYSATPVAVYLPEPAAAVAAGMFFSLALGESGKVYAWGWNARGQLALQGRHDRFLPVRVPDITDALAIAAGQAHAVALTASSLLGWGSNAAGQIGSAEIEQRHPFRLVATSSKETLHA
jgi:alpha-tubulin suppressor-like RCC1 family protein